MEELLSHCERKRLRNQGRDAYYRLHSRDPSLERAAKAARGENARRRQLDDHKRQECARRFMQLPPEEQVRVCPDFAAYIADTNRREESDVAPSIAEASSVPEEHEIAEPLLEAAPASSASRPQRERGLLARRLALGKRSKKVGRTAKMWSQKAGRSRRRLVFQVMQLLTQASSSAATMATILSAVLEKACALFPGLAGALASHGISTRCRCGKLADVLKNMAGNPEMKRREDWRVAVAGAVQCAGFKSQRQAKTAGIDIARRPWKLAKHGRSEKAGLPKRGRPSLLSNPEAQALVVKAALQNSNDSSKFMIVNKEVKSVRHWTTLPAAVYTRSQALMKAMSYRTFVRILAQECPHVKRGTKLTDYCDHCHAFSSVMVPPFGSCYRKPFRKWASDV